jgi:FkbM family methyltransferase
VAPYSALLEQELATVVGMEPLEEECRKLNQIFGPPHIFLPYAVADGNRHTLYVCNEAMTSSLFKPNRDLLRSFDSLEEMVRVVDEMPIETWKLDDIPEAAGADYLKIDVQGGELEVLKGASRVLSEVLVVHTEVEFAPLYKGQPLFAEVDRYLRQAGFYLFYLDDVQTRAYRPFTSDQIAAQQTKQALWTDAVYVKSLFDLSGIGQESLLKLFVIMHFVYGAFDLCAQIMGMLEDTSDAVLEQYGIQAANWLES